MNKNKKSWYDGHFYDKFIAPNQDSGYQKIHGIIPKESSVIDVGCGTGRLSFQLADYCSKVIGVDVSLKNINVAEWKKQSSDFVNVEFVHSDVNSFSTDNVKYDFAVFSYMLHEISEVQRIDLIKKIKGISDKIIISDYLVPMPKNLWGRLTQVVEYLAGSDHYNNFKDYVRLGGIDYLVKKTGLRINREIKENSKTSHIVVLE